MWTFTIKSQFVMSLSMQSPMMNSHASKPSTWKRSIKRSDVESIYRNYKTWIVDDTLITLHPPKNLQLHLIATMISHIICHLHCHNLPNHLSIFQEPLRGPSTAFKDNQRGESLSTQKVPLINFHLFFISSRELSFKKGDIIYIRRQIDKNWYEGEHNANIGLLPVQYVDVRDFLLSIEQTIVQWFKYFF